MKRTTHNWLFDHVHAGNSKAKVPTDHGVTWWATPTMQHDREAFAKRLEESERQRIQNHERFGGAKKVHD